MASIQELREAVGKARADAIAINEKAKSEGRDLTAEEMGQWESANDAFDKAREALDAENAKQANAQSRDEKLAAMAEFLNKSPGRKTDANTPKGKEKAEGERHRTEPHVSAAFNKFLINGHTNLQPGERAALGVDTSASGGTLVAPEEFVADLIKFVDDRVYIRSLATVLPVTDADSLGIPTWDADPSDAVWTSEIGTGDEDTASSTGKRVLKPHPLGKRIKISRTLLRKSVIPAEQLVRERLGYKFAVTEEKAFLAGSGANEPLGLFTASANGISTGRDVSTDNTLTEIKADGLINAKFALKAQYMASPNTRWIFHRTAVRNIRKLKDGNGQYLWQMGLGGSPDTILEVPYLMSEFAPSTFTTGLYVGIIGDLTWYYIADSLRMEIQRLDELYAATNQVGFIGRLECDGAPVLEEAFARVKLA